MTEQVPDALQVAMVRLRLEGTPFRELHRRDTAATSYTCPWPFAEDRVLRIIADPIQGSPGVLLATASPVYVMSDGIERALTNAYEFAPFHSIAMAVGGMWTSSGHT